MKIKILLLLTVLLSLGACSGDDISDSKDSASLSHFENSDFSIDVPAAWKQLSVRDAGITRVTSGEIQLIASADNERFGVSNSLLIMKETKTPNISLKEYVDKILYTNLQEMYSAKKLEGGIIRFNDGAEGILNIYDLQYSQKTNRSKYIIVVRECDSNIYVSTVAIDPSVTDYQRYINFMKSFSCSQ